MSETDSILAVRGKCQGRVVFSLVCALCEIEEIRLPGSFEKVEASEGEGQRETAGAGAAGVDIEDAVAPVGFGFVGVSADDDVVSGGRRIEVEFLKIVEDVDRNVVECDDFGQREGGGPGCGVHVAAHGEDRSDGF
jgi:hypothetical protein